MPMALIISRNWKEYEFPKETSIVTIIIFTNANTHFHNRKLKFLCLKYCFLFLFYGFMLRFSVTILNVFYYSSPWSFFSSSFFVFFWNFYLYKNIITSDGWFTSCYDIIINPLDFRCKYNVEMLQYKWNTKGKLRDREWIYSRFCWMFVVKWKKKKIATEFGFLFLNRFLGSIYLKVLYKEHCFVAVRYNLKLKKHFFVLFCSRSLFIIHGKIKYSSHQCIIKSITITSRLVENEKTKKKAQQKINNKTMSIYTH